MELLINPSGVVRCVYDESIDLSQIGKVDIRRASHVEPTIDGRWIADLSPTDGPKLGPFQNRSEAIRAELHWLQVNWLIAGR